MSRAAVQERETSAGRCRLNPPQRSIWFTYPHELVETKRELKPFIGLHERLVYTSQVQYFHPSEATSPHWGRGGGVSQFRLLLFSNNPILILAVRSP